MNRQVALSILALAAVVASVLWITRNIRRQPQTIAASLSHAVSAAAVQQVTSLLHGRGNILVLAAADCDECNVSRELREAFISSIKSESGLHVLAAELVSIAGDEKPGLPAEVYRAAQQGHPGADAIVSLVGAPAVARSELARHPGKFIVVLTAGNGEALRQLVADEAIDAAIIPRTQPPAGARRPPQTVREIFDFNYEVVVR